MGDIPHLLLHCPSLSSRRNLLGEYWMDRIKDSPVRLQLLNEYQAKLVKYKMQFMLDCSALPNVKVDTATHGSEIMELIFKLTRTFCFSINSERIKKLDR